MSSRPSDRYLVRTGIVGIASSILLLVILGGCDSTPTAHTSTPSSHTNAGETESNPSLHLTVPKEAVITGSVHVRVGYNLAPLANAAVYLKQLPATGTYPPDKGVEVRVNCGTITPPCVCVPANQPVKLIAEDKEPHFYAVLSARQPQYGHFMPQSSKEIVHTFPKLDDCVKLSCSIHASEALYVTVVPNSCHTTTDKDGHFRLPYPLPPGTYTVKFYHKDHGRAEQPVTLKEGVAEVKIRQVYDD